MAFGEYAKARAALTLRDDAPFNPGEKQCQFCRAKATCRALAEHSVAVAAEDFKAIDAPITLKTPDTLSNTEISALLPQMNLIVGWTKAVNAYALGELQQGREVPGYKLVAGKSNRAWSDEGAAEKALRKSKLKVTDIFTKKLISPKQAEDLLGKGHPILKKCVVKPEGKPTIAEVSDKRPPLQAPLGQDFLAIA